MKVKMRLIYINKINKKDGLLTALITIILMISYLCNLAFAYVHVHDGGLYAPTPPTIYPADIKYYGVRALHEGVNVVDIWNKFVERTNIVKLIISTEKEIPIAFVVSVPEYVDVELPKQVELYRFVEINYTSLEPKTIKSKIVFRVENEHIKDGDIKLLQLKDNNWSTVDVNIIGKDDRYFYFESEWLDELGVFAIVKVKEIKEPVLTPLPTPTPTPISPSKPIQTPVSTLTPETEDEEEKKTPGFLIITAIASLVTAWVVRKRAK